MFEFLPHSLNVAIPFLIVLGVLVFFHELGHYLAARWRGVHVEAFSIGFGRALASWQDKQGTHWKLAWIPLGGYVKLHGQERPEDVDDDVRSTWRPGQTYHEKSVLSRAIIIAAGPMANFALAAVVFAGLFAFTGEPVILDVLPPVVGQVAAGGPADRAGLKPGDRIESIDGTAIASFDDVQRIISARPAEAMKIGIRRGDASQTIDLVTDAKEEGGHRVGRLGIVTSAVSGYRHVSVPEAILAGVVHTWDVIVQTLGGLGQILTGKVGASSLGGPLGIANLAGQAAEMGPGTLINLIGFLSVNLGLVNLFPIPVLDGGHLLFLLAEAVRGRPLPPRAVEYGFRAGLALLACLMVFATWNDLARFGLFHWVQGLIG